ncbi:arginyltransferase [Sneathiella chinensis]|uniref:Aspartate/glutamate leucyltransferase n=1 Tax=Sneathiella chinensis TaxID=349750 RepID=A0ABQ5U588_9PROT|nr:arginyltransferase [Sneathiella chinensis]GLQ06444.1 putative arginyl-tRNA--protein transferase [Sneathiella chinensis]
MKRVEIPSRFFFSTPPAPCPYLTGRLERKIVTLLAGEEPDHLHNALSLAGFRRSQDLAYRPACEGCNACIPIRVKAKDFTLNKSFKRIWSRNRDLKVTEKPPLATDEHYALFHRYLTHRHSDGGMVDMDYSDYQAMVEDSPVRSQLVEFRRADGTLYGVCLTDLMDDGLSLVYSYFDPDEEKRSPGTFLILWHILQAKYLAMPNVYLGYWIAQSPKMSYKERYQPAEILTKEGWQPL